MPPELNLDLQLSLNLFKLPFSLHFPRQSSSLAVNSNRIKPLTHTLEEPAFLQTLDMQPHPAHQILAIYHHIRLEEQPVARPEFVHQHDAITNFGPSLTVVTGILAIVFLVTILLVLYFRFCPRHAATITGGEQQDDRRPSVFSSPAANVNPLSGLDKKSIQSLPFFRFGVLRGSKEGLECSVCLSKYEDAEILRLLPKCRHAFHVDCVDRWLIRHSTCPLCRSEVVVNDAENNLEDAEDSISIGNHSSSASIVNNEGVDLFVDREDEEGGDQDSVVRRTSPVFSIGSSFRRLFARECRIPISVCGAGAGDRVLHKHNHKIVFSDVVFKNRWSNVSSSDLIFLNSEMMISSDRLSNRDLTGAIAEAENFQTIGEELRTKAPISIELAKRDSNVSSSSPTRALLNAAGDPGDSSLVEGRRSVSEITLYSRFKELGWMNYRERENPATSTDAGSSVGGMAEEEGEMKRKIWFPIARKTVEWFANARRDENESKRNQNFFGLNAV